MAETITSGEICRRYHISRTALREWRADPDFPAPLSWHPTKGGTWALEDIITWRRRKTKARSNRRTNALQAYERRAGERGALTRAAAANGVSVTSLRRWARAAGLPLPSDADEPPAPFPPPRRAQPTPQRPAGRPPR